MKKILIDDSLITGGRPSAMQDPNWHRIEDRFEFELEDKKISVFNEDVYWVERNEIVDILKKHSRLLLFIDGAYSTVGNGIVIVNNGKKDDTIQIQVHAY